MAKKRKLVSKLDVSSLSDTQLMGFAEIGANMQEVLMDRGDALFVGVHTKQIPSEEGQKKQAILQKWLDEYSAIFNVCNEELGNRIKKKAKVSRSPREISNTWTRWTEEFEFLKKTPQQMQNDLDEYRAKQQLKVKEEKEEEVEMKVEK